VSYTHQLGCCNSVRSHLSADFNTDINMKSAVDSSSGAQSVLHRKRLPSLGKQMLLHASWLVLYHILNFYLAPPVQQELALAVSRSINEAVPYGINKPDDVYSLLEQLQMMQDPNGPMAGSEVIAGGILLRQMRVVSRKCSANYASIDLTICAPPYSELDEEQEFKPFRGAPLSQEVLQQPEYTWQSADSSGDKASQGLPASGFTIRLASANLTAAAIARMKQNVWVDAKTRAIFATCCFYNKNVQIVACSRAAVLVGSTGLFTPPPPQRATPAVRLIFALTSLAATNLATVYSISRSTA
jgi:hypothetical protein